MERLWLQARIGRGRRGLKRRHEALDGRGGRETVPGMDFEAPIMRRILPHTGRLDGDDTGYRSVAVALSDAQDPDLLVRIDGAIPCHPVYAMGARPRVTPFYGGGLGADARVLVRAPVARALDRVRGALRPHRRDLLVLDGWRSASTQARLWSAVYQRLRGEAPKDERAGVVAEIGLGRRADDTASYCPVVKDGAYAAAVAALKGSRAWDEILAAGSVLDAEPAALVEELVTYRANDGALPLRLDTSANTAHGSGGACDLWMIDSDTDLPVNLGVPFDSTSPAAVMDFFEWAAVDRYADLAAADAGLRAYLADFGLSANHVDEDVFAAIRRERRLLYHATASAGASFFSLGRGCGEPWHFNFGNEDGGKQARLLPGGGNACHSLLKDVRDPTSGAWMAVWGNAAAHALAAAA